MPNQQDSTLQREPSTDTEHSSAAEGIESQCHNVRFIPLDSRDPDCLLGYRSNATHIELFDAAMLRQNALTGALHVLGGSAKLDGLDSRITGLCLQALLILSEEANALFASAFTIKPAA